MLSEFVFLISKQLLTVVDFGAPTGKIVNGSPEYVIEPNLKGFLGAAYSLGAICALPFIPWINQRLGRRWTIFFGSCISLVGAVIQGFANGSTY
jgi:MFS family permease